MELDFWNQRWINNEIGFHQNRVNVHLERNWARVCDSPARVFVPLCGKTGDMVWLANQGSDVIGVEISPIAVQAFFDENGLKPTVTDEAPFKRWQAGKYSLLEGDFFQLSTRHLGQINAVYDRASLVALPPAMRQNYVRHLAKLLPSETACLLVAFDYPQSEMDGPPFSVPPATVADLFSHEFNIKLLYQDDVLNENGKFRERGVTRLTEDAYHLVRK